MTNSYVHILGAPGSGKTVVAKAISATLSADLGMESHYMDEYATQFVAQNRDDIASRGGMLDIRTQYIIANEQLRLEKQVDQSLSQHVIVTDTSLLLNYVYACRAYTWQAANGGIAHGDRMCMGFIHDTALAASTRRMSVILLPVRASAANSAHTCKRLDGHMDLNARYSIYESILGMLNVWGVPYYVPRSEKFVELVGELAQFLKGADLLS